MSADADTGTDKTLAKPQLEAAAGQW